MKKLLFYIVTSMFLSGAAQAAGLPGPVVDSAWLAKNQNKVVILDVRADIKSFTSKPVFIKDKKSGKSKLAKVGGHVDGARLVNYKKVRTDRTIDGKKVTRSLPVKKDFETLMQSAGLNQNDVVVIVSKGESNSDMTMATRLYWQLKYYGHKDLAILDGGMAQWLLDKQSISTKASKIKKGNWQATTEDKTIFASSEDVAKSVAAGDTQLIDTRAVSMYLGTYRKSYVYSPGHIAGAKNYPNELLTESSSPARFISKDDSAKLFKALGIDPAASSITYCNSGHLASGSWFVLHEVLGNKNVKLYDGSMHQWTLEKRPTTSVVETK